MRKAVKRTLRVVVCGVLLITVLTVLNPALLSAASGGYDPKADADNRKIVNNCVIQAIAQNLTGQTSRNWDETNKYYNIAVLLEKALQCEPNRNGLSNMESMKTGSMLKITLPALPITWFTPIRCLLKKV